MTASIYCKNHVITDYKNKQDSSKQLVLSTF
jgi:hypothetical protein